MMMGHDGDFGYMQFTLSIRLAIGYFILVYTGTASGA